MDLGTYLMPSLVIALGPSVAIGRVLRGALLDAMRQDHVRTARSKGISEWAVLLRHALRNALTPVLSMAGLQLGLVLTGVIVVETVFAWLVSVFTPPRLWSTRTSQLSLA